MAKKKADDMREQLRQIITYTRGPSAWQEPYQNRSGYQKKTTMMIYAQKERQRFWVEVGVSIVLGGLIVIGVVWFGVWVYEYKYG